MKRMALPAWAVVGAVLSTGAFAQNTVTIGTSPTADISDWVDEFCVADPDPADCDDISGQADGKGACIASNYAFPGPATTIYLRYDFDDVGTAGAGNTMDGCWLVDINQNGNSDRGLCFSITSTGGTASGITTTLFTCNDSAATTCGGASAVASSAVCAFNNAVADAQQLADCAATDNDLAVECSVALADLGWSSGTVALVQGCSSTSAQPNSSTFDCYGSPAAPLIIDPTDGNNTPVELQHFVIE